jgi:hypothetical protein
MPATFYQAFLDGIPGKLFEGISNEFYSNFSMGPTVAQLHASPSKPTSVVFRLFRLMILAYDRIQQFCMAVRKVHVRPLSAGNAV